MSLPFTPAEFLDVFRRYNEAVWPVQWVLGGLGLAAVVLAWRAGRGGTGGSRQVNGILAALWLWTGAVYHLAFFRAINPAAVAFGALCLTQAALFGVWGVSHARIVFQVRNDLAGVTGAILVAFALLGYPVLGAALGHHYPSAPTFGLPCPTTIFTLGILLWTREPCPRGIVVTPLLWAVVGSFAAAQLGMLEDFGLGVAAVAVLDDLVRRHRIAVRVVAA